MSKSGLSRRGFISTAATAAAGAGLTAFIPSLAVAQDDKSKPSEDKKEIIHRTLGRTGFKLPIISMGVMNANNPEVVQASYELGVRHFDTAALYQFGRNEQMVGRVIKNMGVRDKVYIATKIFHREHRQAHPVGKKKEAFIKAFNASLKRLNMDYVDILYIHSIYGDVNLQDMHDPETMEAITMLKQQGKIRASGVSTHRAMAAVVNDVAEKGFYDVVLTSINVSMAGDAELLSAIENAAKKGVGIVAMKTQAGGTNLPNPETLRNFSSSIVNTAALKWVMRNKNIHTAIPGYINYEHMNEDFSVANSLELNQDEQKFLDDNNIRLSFGFCQQCTKCLASCPENTDIPILMRTHMYAAQYTNFEHARITLNSIPKEQSLKNCVDCSECVARCVNSVNIKENIDRLKMIYA